MGREPFQLKYEMRNRNSPLEGESGIIKAFLRHRMDLAPQTLAWYEGMLIRFCDWLRLSKIEPNVAALNIDTTEQYIESRRQTVKVSSTRCDAIVLKSLGQYVGRRILKTKSPLVDLKLPPIEDSNKRALTGPELNRLLVASRKGPYGIRNYAIVMVGAGCGLRLGELTALTVGDICLDRLNEAISVSGRTSKSKHTRRIALPDETVSALSDYLTDHPADKDAEAPLFLSRGMTALRRDGFVALFRALAIEAQIPGLTAHVLRHTWATNYLRNGTGSIVELTHEAGWRDRQNRMAMRYVHQAPISERRKRPSPFAGVEKVITFPQKSGSRSRSAVS